MTAEEILHKHISKECMDELSKNVWPDMLDAMEEYAKYYHEQQSKLIIVEDVDFSQDDDTELSDMTCVCGEDLEVGETVCLECFNEMTYPDWL